MSANQIKVTLVRSVIGSNEKVRATVRGSGLTKDKQFSRTGEQSERTGHDPQGAPSAES